MGLGAGLIEQGDIWNQCTVTVSSRPRPFMHKVEFLVHDYAHAARFPLVVVSMALASLFFGLLGSCSGTSVRVDLGYPVYK